MTNMRWLGAASALVLALAACGVQTNDNQQTSGNAATPAAPENDGLAKLAEVRMDVDTSYLSAEEREVVNLLIQAANRMSEIYKRQATPN